MPGFLSSSTALTVYDQCQAVSIQKLQQFAFHPIDDIPDPKAWGWTNIDDIFDPMWETSSPLKGPFVTFAFRVDTRKLSPAVLKKHLADALKAEEEAARATGGTVSRARKKELKELYASRLLSKTEPVPMSVDVALDTSTGTLYLASTSSGLLELFEAYFDTSFGNKPEPRGQEERSLEAVGKLFRLVQQEGITVAFDGHEYALSDAGILLLRHPESGAEVLAKNEPDAVINGLQAGMHIQKMKIRMERVGEEDLAWEYTLTLNQSFSGLKTPSVKKSDDNDDPDAVLLEKLYLISLVEGVIRTALVSLEQ